MTDESYYSSSTEEEYDREYNRLATDINEERFMTPHGDISSDQSSDENSNAAHNGSNGENQLDDPIEDDSVDDDPLEGYSIEEDSHNYSDISAPSEHEGRIRSHHRVNRITMYSDEEDMFEYSDGDVRFPTRWHEGDTRVEFPEPDMSTTLDGSNEEDDDDPVSTSSEHDDSSEEDNDERISSASDRNQDESDDLPSNLLEYLDGIAFEDNCQKAKIVTDQCKYTLEENTKCVKCHVCGDTYSAEGILDNHSYHPRGKLPECPTCKTTIEVSVLSELFDKATVLDFIKIFFNERLCTPVFEAYVDTIKLLHENGYINPDSDKKTVIDFLKELVNMRDGYERPIPLDISQGVYEYMKMMENYINELLTAVPLENTEKQMRMIEELNALPVKYGLSTTPLEPIQQMRETTAKHIISSALFYRNEYADAMYSCMIETATNRIIIQENIIGQSPRLDARFKGYTYNYDSAIDATDIPELKEYFPSTEPIINKLISRRYYPMSRVQCVHIIQPHCTIIHKTPIVIPRVLPVKDAFHGPTKQKINAVKYYIEFARILSKYIDHMIYSPALSFNANELEKEFNDWYQRYASSINSPSEIIGMVYQMITENSSIDASFKASNHDRTYSIFKRANVSIQVLIDATIDAMVPMATPTQRRIINEMLTKNEKENPFHRCPLRFLKSLTATTELLCSCGGPILEHQCLLCRRDYCPHCHEPKDYYHSCDPVVLETIKILDSTTVRCPKCATRIQKSDGCDHMFCINCHCNFDWKTGKAIKESEQTNEMYERAMQGAEREYMYYLHKFIAYFESTKSNMLKPKSDLLFYTICRNTGIRFTDISIFKEIDKRLTWIYNEKRYKDAYRALRPVIASTIEDAMQILGTTVDDYQAERMVERIIGKGVDILRQLL